MVTLLLMGNTQTLLDDFIMKNLKIIFKISVKYNNLFHKIMHNYLILLHQLQNISNGYNLNMYKELSKNHLNSIAITIKFFSYILILYPNVTYTYIKFRTNIEYVYHTNHFYIKNYTPLSLSFYYSKIRLISFFIPKSCILVYVI